MQIEPESSLGNISNGEGLGIDRPRVYYGWHGQEAVLIGISYGGRTHLVEKNQTSGYWESVVRWQGEVGMIERRDRVTRSTLLADTQRRLLVRYLPGGEEYSQLRLATKDDFDGELE